MAKKNTAQLSLFAETVYEYFILLSPSDPIKEEVDRMKELLHGMIGLEPFNRNSVAHVSLFKTEAVENGPVVRQVKKIASAVAPFTITLAGHEVLKHGGVSRTLCLKIEDPEPINKLVALLNPAPQTKRSYRQTSILDKRTRAKKIIHPHITIARSIPTADFDRVDDLSAFDISGEWLCDRITILRRIAGSTGHFSPVSEVVLGG
ncbi:2'-5' RNA ligase family protein [Flavobacterium sp.]|uniref:2'-5' RNA ligase family protein n=1 Tax=Flavobacterium sp. TaxID=239 RepID=UPI004033F3AB